MKKRVSKEQISAYYDGETSSKEQADVLRALESPETAGQIQKELSDHQRLSELLQEQPEESAPIGFLAQVLHAAERESLLSDSDTTSTRDSSSILKQSFGPLLTVAAMLLLAAGIVYFLPDSNSEENTVAHSENDPLSEELAESNPEHVPGGVHTTSLLTEGERKLLEFQKETAKGKVATNGVADLAMKAAGQKSVERPKNSESNLAENINEEIDSERESKLMAEPDFLFSADLETVKVGQVVEALETDGDHVAVVRLTVVDRQKGIEALHVLLSRNQIPLQQTSATDEQGKPSDLENKEESGSRPTTKAEGELVAVYVEATQAQLELALKQMRDQKDILGLSVRPSLNVAQLDKNSDLRMASTSAPGFNPQELNLQAPGFGGNRSEEKPDISQTTPFVPAGSEGQPGSSHIRRSKAVPVQQNAPKPDGVAGGSPQTQSKDGQAVPPSPTVTLNPEPSSGPALTPRVSKQVPVRLNRRDFHQKRFAESPPEKLTEQTDDKHNGDSSTDSESESTPAAPPVQKLVVKQPIESKKFGTKPRVSTKSVQVLFVFEAPAPAEKKATPPPAP